MRDFSTAVNHTIPGFALLPMNVSTEPGIDRQKRSPLKFAVIGAEPCSEEVRLRMEDFYGIKAYNSHGISEINGTGVAFECPSHRPEKHTGHITRELLSRDLSAM